MIRTLSLGAIQQHFTECLFDGDKGLNESAFKTTVPDSINKRLDIYRNNVFYSLTCSLADLYPVIKQLVGAEFFKATARAYLQIHPPVRAAMVYFGENFPDFLLGFEHTRDNIWLADVARLELAWHQSYHARDSLPLDPASLGAIPPEQLAQSGIILHPSVRLLSSDYPILQIWESNQSEGEITGQIELDSGGETLCIFRPEYQVMLKLLDTGAYAFLSDLQNGSTLEQAMITAAEQDPDFIAEQCLAQCLTDGLFEDIMGKMS